MIESPLNLAKYYRAHGLAPIPIKEGTKQAAVKWQQFQNEAPQPRDLPTLFNSPHLTVGIVTGEASDRLLVVDVDNYKRVDRILKEMGHPETWIVQTARGAHIYVRTPVTAKSSRSEGADLQAQGHYVLAAGALHPTGIRYAWLNHPDQIKELDSLEIWPGLTLQPAALRPSDIPRKAWDLLTGHTQARYDSKTSGREWAALCSLINTGFDDLDRITALFDQHAAADGHYKSKILPKGAHVAHEWLAADYKRAVEFVQTHESADKQTAHGLKMWALSQTWPGHTGAYDRAVYLAWTQVAERAGTLLCAPGARRLAEIAGVSKYTACNATKRLASTRYGLLKRVTPATVTRPAVWQLLLPSADWQNLYTKSLSNVRKCTSFAHHSVFRWNGLGKTGAIIWEALQDGQGHSSGEIARHTERSIKTVKKCLERMRQVGMVTFEIVASKAGHEWRAVLSVDLDQIAEKFGTLEAGARQRAQHERERHKHRQALERGRVTA